MFCDTCLYLLPRVTITPFSVEKESDGRPYGKQIISEGKIRLFNILNRASQKFKHDVCHQHGTLKVYQPGCSILWQWSVLPGSLRMRNVDCKRHLAGEPKRQRNIGFNERGKAEYSEKNLSEQGREPTTNSTHIWHRVQQSNPSHIGGRQVLSPLRHLHSPELDSREIQPWRWQR